MKTKTWLIGGAIGVVALAALAWAFAPRPVAVETAAVARGRFEAVIEEDARTRVRDRYVVSAPLAGQLGRITLREGDAVNAGAVLATLMPALSPLLDERTLRQQEIGVQGAQAGVALAAARVARAQAGVKQAAAETKRSEQLAQQGFIAPQKAETDRLGMQAAQRELQAAREQAQIAAHELAQARAALAAATRTGTERTFALRAPVSARVLRIVQPSETTVALGTPLIELGDTTRMELVAELLTGDAIRVPPGARVVVDRWGGPGTLEGRVQRVEPGGFTKVSALGVEEQRVRVLIDLTSPPANWHALGDGYRVGVRIVTQDVADALLVPVAAVFPLPSTTAPAGSAVFVVDGGRARRVNVEVAARNERVAWIKGGLEPGARVVIYPSPTVADDVRVKALD